MESIDKKRASVRANGDMLAKIVDGEKIDATELLLASPFDIRYNEFHVVNSVSRPM